MKFDNIIPLGDHCAAGFILKDLELRKKSYPFDWTNHAGGIMKTSIYKNIFLLNRLLIYANPEKVSAFYLGKALENPQMKLNNGIQFPHETDNTSVALDKYKRRFNRLLEDIVNKNKNLYIIICRKVEIQPEMLNELFEKLLTYNKESEIVIFTGNERTLVNFSSQPNITIKYVPYNEITKEDVYAYDVTFRENIKTLLLEIIK